MGTYITLEDVEAYVGSSFNGTTIPTDAQVNTWIGWASDEVELITNQTFGTVLVSDEKIDFTRFESFNQDQTGYAIGNVLPKGVSYGRNDFTYNNMNGFRTNKRPIISVSSLTANTGSPTNPYNTNFVEDTDFITYKELGKIVVLQNIPSLGLKRFNISYVAGTEIIPNTVKRLTTLMVSREIMGSSSVGSSYGNPDSISVGPISISKSTGGNVTLLKNMDDEIERLKTEIGILNVELV